MITTNATEVLLFTGFEHSRLPNWQQKMPLPQKPGNWREETFQAKLPELVERQAAKAATHLLAGSISRVAYMTTQQSGSIEPMCKTPAEYVDKLITELRDSEKNNIKITVVAINAAEELRLLAWQMRAAGRPVVGDMWLGHPKSRLTIINPYSLCGAKTEGLSVADTVAHWCRSTEKFRITKEGEYSAESAALAVFEMWESMNGL
jgi:hypothetical protein